MPSWRGEDEARTRLRFARMRSVAAPPLLLACARGFLYAGSMQPRLRRLADLVLSLTFAVGLVGQGMRVTDMSAKTNKCAHAMAADMSMAAAGGMMGGSNCDACKNCGCKGAGCMSSDTCSCANPTALPVLGTVIAVPMSEMGAGAHVPFQMGWAAPPDPHPPRPSLLS
jgi:hypothetical protein